MSVCQVAVNSYLAGFLFETAMIIHKSALQVSGEKSDCFKLVWSRRGGILIAIEKDND